MIISLTRFNHLSSADPVFELLQQKAALRQTFSRAKGTFKNRQSTLKTYLAFCFRMKVDPQAPSYQQFTAYMEYAMISAKSPKTILNKVAHIRMHMKSVGVPLAPFYHQRVQAALDAIKRDKSYIPRPKLPIPMSALKKVLAQFHTDPMGRMQTAVVLLIFHGALRQSEVLPPSIKSFSCTYHLTRDDVRLTPDFAMVKIKAGKNLQLYNQSREVTLIPAKDKRYCPISALQAVLDDTPTASPEEPMFMFPHSRLPVPTSFMNARWLRVLKTLGISPAPFSLHSLRKAAATEAHRSGCSDQQIKDFGGWTSSAYKHYITRDSHATVNLAISKALQS